MTTAASGKKRPEPSAWAEVLAKGVDGWSDFSDTDDEGDGADAEEGAPSPGPFPRPRAGTSGDLASKAANSGPGGAADAADKQAGDQDPAKLAKEPKRAALDAGWKRYRRDVEWQCRWLELRMKEIGGHIERYEGALEEMERPREATIGGASSPKPSAGDDLKRRRVADPSASPPPAPDFGAHPLFARSGAAADAVAGFSGKKRRKNAPGDKADKANAAATEKGDGKEFPSEHGAAAGVDSDSDISTAALYEQIETLQRRVLALHQRLGQPAPAMQPAGSGKAAGAGGAGGRKLGAGGASQGATPGVTPRAGSRRAADDFDINNVVGAAPTGAKFVERAQHADISTPSGRPAPAREGTNPGTKPNPNPSGVTGEKGDGGESDTSSEDTSDEAYVRRHAKLEIAERAARTLPDKKDKRGAANPGAGGGDKTREGGSGPGGGKAAAAAAAAAAEAAEAESKRQKRENGEDAAKAMPTPMDAEDDAGPGFDSAALAG